MRLLFKGGTVVTGKGPRRADVLVEDEKILDVCRDIPAIGAQVVDVTGMLLFPGFIDAHTHFDLDVCNTTTADDFASGSRAALRGGTTTIIDFACPNKGETLHDGLRLWHEKADGKCACDYGFHMTIDDWNDGIRAELPQMFDEGISSFKMYMTYPAMMIGDEAMFHALREMKRLGGIVGVHCENAGMIDALIAEKKATGALSPASHPLCRPAEAEAEAVGRLLKLARVADVPVMIVHLSTAAALREGEAARGLGQKVFVETCPHYLLLDDSRYSLPDFAGARYVCAPPLRKKLDNERLWKALADGEIQTVSTDHCSFTLAQKDAGRGDFTKIPGGMPGVETRGTLLFTYGVAAGRITAERMADVLAETPAKLYGLFPRKGVLQPGADADIVVYDPRGTSCITAADQAANVDYAPYEGTQIAGHIAEVYLRGTCVVREGKILHDRNGQYLHRGKCML